MSDLLPILTALLGSGLLFFLVKWIRDSGRAAGLREYEDLIQRATKKTFQSMKEESEVAKEDIEEEAAIEVRRLSKKDIEDLINGRDDK